MYRDHKRLFRSLFILWDLLSNERSRPRSQQIRSPPPPPSSGFPVSTGTYNSPVAFDGSGNAWSPNLYYTINLGYEFSGLSELSGSGSIAPGSPFTG